MTKINLAKSLVLVLIALSSRQVYGGAMTELLADDVSDGPCLSMSDLMPHLYHGVNLVPIMTSGTYFVPMGSKSLYRQYATALLGRPAISQREVDSMQLLLQCGPLFTTIENTGFPFMDNPPRFTQTCASVGLPSFPNLGIFSGSLNVDYVQAVCIGLPAIRPDGTTALHASSSFSSTMDSIIWVNEDNTVFMTYRCPADGLKDYKVVSKTKTLKEDDIAIIKEKLAEMGFRWENIAYMRYVE